MALLGYCAARAEGIASGGRVSLDGVDILADARGAEGRRLRGSGPSPTCPRIPGRPLNPALKIGYQLPPPHEVHPPLARPVGGEAEANLRRIAGAAPPAGPRERVQRPYPLQLTGGQQQRVALALAFATRPRVLVPATSRPPASDVTAQARGSASPVCDLCPERRSVPALFVTHDLAVGCGVADQRAVIARWPDRRAGRATRLFCGPAPPLHPLAAPTPRRTSRTARQLVRHRRHNRCPRPAPAGAVPSRRPAIFAFEALPQRGPPPHRSRLAMSTLRAAGAWARLESGPRP